MIDPWITGNPKTPPELKDLDKLGKIRAAFQAHYRAMLDGVLARKLPTAVCSIYGPRYLNPDTRNVASTGLSVFNDTITREAFARGVPI